MGYNICYVDEKYGVCLEEYSYCTKEETLKRVDEMNKEIGIEGYYFLTEREKDYMK